MQEAPRPPVSLPDLGVLTFGTSGLGHGTAPGSPEARQAIDTAVALLRTPAYVDTSNAYAGGRSEEVLGAALAELDPAERLIAAERIITKIDRDPHTARLDGDRVRRSLEESLTRLGLDRIRSLHLHDPYTVPFSEALAPGGAIAALVALREEGVVERIGIAAGRTPVVARYVESGAFDMVLTHNRHTLVDHSADELLHDARERGMTIFNAAPFGGDLLAKGSRAGTSYAYTPVSDALRAWVADVEALCAEHAVPLAAVALQESTRSPLVDSTVVGISSPARIEQITRLAVIPIPEALLLAIRALGPAPTPIDDPEEIF